MASVPGLSEACSRDLNFTSRQMHTLVLALGKALSETVLTEVRAPQGMGSRGPEHGLIRTSAWVSTPVTFLGSEWWSEVSVE